MNIRSALGWVVLAALSLGATAAHAARPNCGAGNGTLLSWPSVDPIWEMCWLPPSASSSTQGSSLELRDVHYKGILVLKRAHSPLLFAEYTSATCYRDWKNGAANFIADISVRNQLGIAITPAAAITSCDRSQHATASYGNCPYLLAGYTTANCFQAGVSIEDLGDHVVLTTQHSASWYQYTSRFTLWGNGTIEPNFGFGNNDGTLSNVTHWHHNYWRLDFDIDGAGNDALSVNDVVQNSEFLGMRSETGGPGGSERTWEVTDVVQGFGYKLDPGNEDYKTPTNQSGRGFHLVDVMGTRYIAGEYGDTAGNSLSDCGMDEENLVNGGDITAGPSSDIVLYYRAGVRDRTNEGAGTQDSMICKKVGPQLLPIGDWPIFRNGFN